MLLCLKTGTALESVLAQRLGATGRRESQERCRQPTASLDRMIMTLSAPQSFPYWSTATMWWVASPNWTMSTGAVTWGSGTSGVTGTVSASNSLIGTTPGDLVGNDGITPLNNGNYVADTSQWSNPAGNAFVGAATWGNGTTGVTGTISSVNSLIGTTANDQVSIDGITALGPQNSNNYLVGSEFWDSSLVDAGAVTYGNGTTGTTGTVSIVNSVVGTSAMSGLNRFLDNPGVPGTFVVSFTNTPAVVIGGASISPPPRLPPLPLMTMPPPAPNSPEPSLNPSMTGTHASSGRTSRTIRGPPSIQPKVFSSTSRRSC